MTDQPDLFDVGPREEERAQRTCTPHRIGSGPAGETCGTCRHAVRVSYHDSKYTKCELVKAYWTHGAGSDIKLRWAACRAWEEKR